MIADCFSVILSISDCTALMLELRLCLVLVPNSFVDISFKQQEKTVDNAGRCPGNLLLRNLHEVQ